MIDVATEDPSTPPSEAAAKELEGLLQAVSNGDFSDAKEIFARLREKNVFVPVLEELSKSSGAWDDDEWDTAGAAVDLIGSRLPWSINIAVPAHVHFAVAGLARCRRLLEGMLAHRDDPDILGLFARTLYETWVVSRYLLLEGTEAMNRLVANDAHFRHKIASHSLQLESVLAPFNLDSMLVAARSVTAEAKPEIGELALIDMAKKVSVGLTGTGGEIVPSVLYAMLYRTESYVSTHGGLGALRLHLTPGDTAETVVIQARQSTPEERKVLVALCACLLLSLYDAVMRALGEDPSDSNVIFERLAARAAIYAADVFP